MYEDGAHRSDCSLQGGALSGFENDHWTSFGGYSKSSPSSTTSTPESSSADLGSLVMGVMTSK